MFIIVSGNWICPWHFCDMCEKKARKLCTECPNSFCETHLEGNLFQLGDSRLICSDHTDLLEGVEEKTSLTKESIKTEAAVNGDITSSSCDSQPVSDVESSSTATTTVTEEEAMDVTLTESSQENGIHESIVSNGVDTPTASKQTNSDSTQTNNKEEKTDSTPKISKDKKQSSAKKGKGSEKRKLTTKKQSTKNTRKSAGKAGKGKALVSAVEALKAEQSPVRCSDSDSNDKLVIDL